MSDRTKRPTPKAAALKYTGVGAPRVVAKGEGYVAEQIHRVAREHDIPLVQDPSLTQLLCQVPLDDEIPPFLFFAVAEVLAHVYRIGKTVDIKE